ncbi:MAG TPA: hypothetical protein DD381_01410 [Lentisphaeria bacterium]|nr:MAG: hypothetical protein A2X47_10620 [Lentisphaerae bacterium GWF2_38_69]HBM15002.1 hypothetical protein [Lentisphaeria bacterium]
MRDFRRISRYERRKIANQLRLDSCRMIAGDRTPSMSVIKHRVWLYAFAAAVLMIGGYFVAF